MKLFTTFTLMVAALVLAAGTAETVAADKNPVQTIVQVLFGTAKKPVAKPATRVASPKRVAEQEDSDASEATPTHQEVAIIEVKNTPGCALNTFCVAPDGNIVAAVGTQSFYAQRGGKSKSAEPSIRIYSPEGKLLKTWNLEIEPQAINHGPNGSLYVAGYGQLIKLDANGKQVGSWDTPNAAAIKKDAKATKAKIIASLQKSLDSIRKMVKTSEDGIKELEEKKELSDSDKRQLSLFKARKRSYENYLKTAGENLEERAESSLKQKMGVTGMAVSRRDVFVACPAIEGYGYEVWRADLNFKNPKRIITELRGCCGNCDIQCYGDDVYVAENARHRVGRYTREGKSVLNFGKRNRTGVEGFGSCCNPMNIRFGAGGELYTSESTVGRIKRYNTDGELVSVVGQAKIVPGCKHVAIGVNKEGDRLYMLDITRSRIVVMAGPTAKDAPVIEKTSIKE